MGCLGTVGLVEEVRARRRRAKRQRVVLIACSSVQVWKATWIQIVSVVLRKIKMSLNEVLSSVTCLG